ncbi:MAG: nicotinate (nicotinamide) nucleotide adenylyltransferase [Oscillospiraceae bacterium]|nr:nicotinate (nicotinamide) nucleotide adenylyltransferase [Oscillospiraceae bacterium]
MKIGIYGGTYNPPHTGHMQAALEAVRLLKLDKLLLIPDRIAPHKEIPSGSPAPEQRLQMLRIAAADCPEMEVSDIELQREGPSYSYLTVEQLRAQYPDAELILLMGTDMFLSFHTWREPERITKEATLGVFFRGEKGEREKILAKKHQLEEAGAKVELVENRILNISSTQLRRLIAFRCAGEFLPEGVYEFIRENGLYDTDADWKNLPMEQLEAVVLRLLNPNRVNHVLGCRDTAVELAKRWGADETDAARAGLLHDITKALDGPLQLTLCREYGTILDEFGCKYPKTLHALTGSLVADRIFGETQAVVSAICHHTTGKAGMTLLEKIIYVADYMEPCRNFPGVERLRELAFSDLDAALKLGLEMTLEHLKNLGDEVSPASREALEFLNKHS